MATSNNKRRRLLLLTVFVVLIGVLCAVAVIRYAQELGERYKNMDASEAGIMGPLLHADELVDLLGASGVKLVSNNEANKFTLDGITPVSLDLPNKEEMFIYVYDSEVVPRAIGYRDFKEAQKNYNKPDPLVYEVRNLLVFYSHQIPDKYGNHVLETEYGETIRQAVERLQGNETVMKFKRIINLEKFRQFMEHVNEKQPDKIRVRFKSVEGGSIFHDVVFDGSSFIYSYDNSHDAYAGVNNGKITVRCSSIEKIITDKHIEYVMKGCPEGNYSTNLFHEPLDIQK